MSLLRSSVVFSAMTLVSRLLGFVRDVVLARLFGAGAAMDAFVVAFKIPNFMRRLFAEGSFSLAFVPVLSEYREKGDEAALKSLIDAVAGCLLAVLLVITALGVLAAPAVISVFAPGFRGDPETYGPAVEMLRITFPYLLFVSLTALAGGILNTLGRFALPALTPALLNIAMIVAAVAFSARFELPIKAVAWGVFVAGIAQMAMLLPSLARHGVLPIPRPDFRHPGVRRILRLMVPTLFGSSVAQINLLFDTLIASLLITASVSWLYFADRLMEFPLGMFGVALSTVILPSLAAIHARRDAAGFRSTLDWALLLGLVIGLPSAAGLAVVAGPLILTLFESAVFTAADARMAAVALMAYCIGLPAFIGVKILAPAYFSRQDTRTPVRIAVIALVVNMGLNVLFVLAIIGWLSGWDFSAGLFPTLDAHAGAHVGLAVASSASAWLNAALLWKNLSGPGLAPSLPWKRIGQVVLACGVMSLALLAALPPLEAWIEAGTGRRVWWLAGSVAGGAAVYALALLLSGMRPGHLARPVAAQRDDKSPPLP